MLHSCGYIFDILDDIKEIGFDSIWPQMVLFDDIALSNKCQELDLALAMHLDRAKLMSNGTPDDIRAAVNRAVEVFKPQKGGSWFYVEVDAGFPFENIEALVTSIAAYR